MQKLITLAIALLFSTAAWSQITGKTFDQLPIITTVDGTTWFVTLDGSPKVWKKIPGSTLRQFLHSKVTQITNATNLAGILSPDEGDLAINVTKDSIWIRDDSAWLLFAGGGSSSAGNIPSLADILTQGNSAGGERITSLGSPNEPTDAANKHYADSVAWDKALTAAQESQFYAVQVSQLALDSADARRYRAVADTASSLRAEIVSSGNTYVKKTELSSQFDFTTDSLKLAQQGASEGQVMKWSGSEWVPSTDEIGSILDTAAMLLPYAKDVDLDNYVTKETAQTISGTKTIYGIQLRANGFTQDSVRLDFSSYPYGLTGRIPVIISKGSGLFPSVGSMATRMSYLRWGSVDDVINGAAHVFMGANNNGTSALANGAIAEFWNYTNSKALRVMADGKLAFGNFTPSVDLDLYGKSLGIRFPVGNTAQRPLGLAGIVRLNSDSTNLEYHDGTVWKGIASTWDASTGGGGGSSVWTQSGSNVYVTGAKVGINTTSPNVMLEIDTTSNQVVPGGWGSNPEPKIVVNSTAGKSAQIAINTSGTTAAAGIQFYSDGVPGADFGYVKNGEIGFANRADGKAVNFYTIGPRRQLSINPTYSSFRSPLYVGDSVKTGNVLNVPTSVLQVAGSFALNVPLTVNASTYTVTYRDNWFICTYAGTTTFTLPDPSTCPGRILYFINRANQTRLGSVAEIIPIAGGSATQTIVANSAGKWVTLVSDGSNWQTLQAN